jgi:hypothetical protein
MSKPPPIPAIRIDSQPDTVSSMGMFSFMMIDSLNVSSRCLIVIPFQFPQILSQSELTNAGVFPAYLEPVSVSEEKFFDFSISAM